MSKWILTHPRTWPWEAWAGLEGTAKATSALLQKKVGLWRDLDIALLAYLVVGVVQTLTGLIGWRTSRTRRLYPCLALVMWPILFGCIASIMTVLGIYTFSLGADLGTRVLIISASIIPGAVLGRMFWGDPLGIPQWVGVALYLFAVFAMQGFSAQGLLEDWVLLTILIAIMAAVNEALTRRATEVKKQIKEATDQELDEWTNLFWVGLSTVVFCGVPLVLWGAFSDLPMLTLPEQFWQYALFFGIITAGMILFKFLAYKDKERVTIALKKLVMSTAYLYLVTPLGILIFDEKWHGGTITGLVICPIAICIADNGTRIFLFGKLSALRQT